MSLNFDIFAQVGPSRTSVLALLFDGKYCGKIIIAWPKDGAGQVKAMVSAYDGTFKGFGIMRGNAGGYGYDKGSAAVHDALLRANVPDVPDLNGRGMGSVIVYLGSIGYKVLDVL